MRRRSHRTTADRSAPLVFRPFRRALDIWNHPARLMIARCGTVRFKSVLDPRKEEAFNQESLGSSVPLTTFRVSHPKVAYSDNFSTVLAQKETLVMARDPNEYEATLEAIGGGDVLQTTQEFLVATVTPFDVAPSWQCDVPNGVTLPNAVAMPFPEAVQRPFGPPGAGLGTPVRKSPSTARVDLLPPRSTSCRSARLGPSVVAAVEAAGARLTELRSTECALSEHSPSSLVSRASLEPSCTADSSQVSRALQPLKAAPRTAVR